MKSQINCPICGARLLDVGVFSIGDIETKCSRCKNILHIEFIPENITFKIEIVSKKTE